MVESRSHEITPWRISYIEQDQVPVKRIFNEAYPLDIGPEAYDYRTNTPIVIAPISRTNALVLSEYKVKDDMRLRITDLRVVGKEIVGSINFIIRGSELQLKKVKYDFIRAADDERCVGVSFLLRKLYYHGFNTIYAPKKLNVRESNTLQNAFNLVKHQQGNHDD